MTFRSCEQSPVWLFQGDILVLWTVSLRKLFRVTFWSCEQSPVWTFQDDILILWTVSLKKLFRVTFCLQSPQFSEWHSCLYNGDIIMGHISVRWLRSCCSIELFVCVNFFSAFGLTEIFRYHWNFHINHDLFDAVTLFCFLLLIFSKIYLNTSFILSKWSQLAATNKGTKIALLYHILIKEHWVQNDVVCKLTKKTYKHQLWNILFYLSGIILMENYPVALVDF